jgi:hypothetical protein
MSRGFSPKLKKLLFAFDNFSIDPLDGRPYGLLFNGARSQPRRQPPWFPRRPLSASLSQQTSTTSLRRLAQLNSKPFATNCRSQFYSYISLQRIEQFKQISAMYSSLAIALSLSALAHSQATTESVLSPPLQAPLTSPELTTS